MSLITQGNNHVFITGITRSGKTYFAHRAAMGINRPVLYFNIQGESVPARFFSVSSGDVEMQQILDLLKSGSKVNLLFGDWKSGYKATAGYVISELMSAGFSEKNPVYLILDECHLLDGYSLDMAKYAATAGLKKGVRLIFVTQRPALADKTLYTQAFEHYLFFLSASEKAYMKAKGIDFERCQAEWARLGKYSYVFYDGYDFQGRRAIG